MVDISDAIRHETVDGMMKGESQRKVGIHFNSVRQSTVHNAWVRYRKTGTTNNQSRSGRPKKTTERERRQFCSQMKRRPFSSPRQLLTDSNFQNIISLTSAGIILYFYGIYLEELSRKTLIWLTFKYVSKLRFARPFENCQPLNGQNWCLQTKCN